MSPSSFAVLPHLRLKQPQLSATMVAIAPLLYALPIVLSCTLHQLCAQFLTMHVPIMDALITVVPITDLITGPTMAPITVVDK